MRNPYLTTSSFSKDFQFLLAKSSKLVLLHKANYFFIAHTPTRFSLHHFLHTFATLMLQQDKENVDLRTLQELQRKQLTFSSILIYILLVGGSTQLRVISSTHFFDK